MSFGSVIREKRTELGIALTDMAERLEISAAYWSRIERDLESPPRDHLIERAAAKPDVGRPSASMLVNGARAAAAGEKGGLRRR